MEKEERKNYINDSLQSVLGEDNDLNDENIVSIEIKLNVIFTNKTGKYLLTYKKNENGIFEVTSISEIKTVSENGKIINKNEEISDVFKYIQSVMFGYIIDTEINKGKKNENEIETITNINLIGKIKINRKQQEPVEEKVGGKVKAKGQKKKPSKKPVVSQSKENKYKEVLGKRMKIYKKPDSRKEFVRYKGELVALVEYKKSKKEMAKSKNAKK